MTAAPAREVLLTVSGRIPDGTRQSITAGERPRADYFALADGLGAELLARPDPGRRGRIRRTLVGFAGEDIAMALATWQRRRRHDVILTDGEQVGLPLAALLALRRRRSRPKHVMIVHVMSVPKKIRLFRLLHLDRGIDGFVVYSSTQQRFIIDELGVPADRVFLRPFMVDTHFFRPSSTTDDTANLIDDTKPVDSASSGGARPTICTAGLEFRDYPTLLRAVTGLDVDLVVGAASPWSKRASELDGVTVPDNVRVDRFSLAELRDLYARSALVVMPLRPVDFQAGITTILEAMAMGRAIVCTRTPGQTDTIVDDVTGIYVAPSDPVALREAITRLLADGGLRERLGHAAREWVVGHAELDRYVEQLGAIVDRYRPSATR
jgi:glycosyltransferase involved in cell wall biosynthesis